MHILKNKAVIVGIVALALVGLMSVFASRSYAGSEQKNDMINLGVYPGFFGGSMKASYLKDTVDEKHGMVQVIAVLNFSEPLQLPGNFRPDGALITFAIDCANGRANKVASLFVNSSKNDMRHLELGGWYPITGPGVELNLARKVC